MYLIYFIIEWLPIINYSKYFNSCAPLFCTYTTTDQTNLSYTIVFLLSLYGGITIILRFITPFLVDILLISKLFSKITIRNKILSIDKFIQWIKQINVFKSFNSQNPNSIKQQYIITRVYLILLAGIYLCLV